MRNFIKKYYIQLIAVTILFVAIILMITRSFSAINMIKEKSTEFKQVQLDNSLAQEFLNHGHIFRQNAKYIEADNDWLSVLLPNDDDEKVKLFSTLEQLAEDTGNNSISLAVNSVEVKKTKKKVEAKDASSTNKSMNMNISLVGSYNDLIYFLQKLENMQYFADVLSFSTEKTSPSTRQNNKIDEEDEVLRDNLLKTTMNVVFYLENNE